MPPPDDNEITLATQLKDLPFVPIERARLLAKLGLFTVRQLLLFFPRDYEDLTVLRTLPHLIEGEYCGVEGTVEDVEQRPRARGQSMWGVSVNQNGQYLQAVWFSPSFTLERLKPGQRVRVYGKPQFKPPVWKMSHPRVVFVQGDEPPKVAMVPKYGLTEGLHQGHVRQLIRKLLPKTEDQFEEVLPQALLHARGLCSLKNAVRQIHLPETKPAMEEARRRLIYQELLILQLALALRRAQIYCNHRAPVLEQTAQLDSRIRRRFPFELTAGQNAAIADISGDLASGRPMNRLLQGEVGSGKTVIALYAMLLAVGHGHQAALMVPTEVLAQQHAATLDKFLKESRVRYALLAGSTPPARRAEILAKLAQGGLDLVIGTQALLNAEVKFSKLALVLIDEQHKFGVEQRALLKQSGLEPHYLVMTATPIPRTVALAMYGDLEVSTLRELPPGRPPINTIVVPPEKQAAWWEFVAKKLKAGRQGYVVTWLLEESAHSAAASVEEVFRDLSAGSLKEFKLALLHGRMPADEKEARMRDFREGKTQVLVATSVIEVGIDVPNACVITICGAQRFGLSQLHQMRGRVGRGSLPGFCGLFVDEPSPEAAERLKAFSETTDGFRLAELDLQWRGHGDLFGTRQHGYPGFHIADLTRDREPLELARDDARQLVKEHPGLAAPDLTRLRSIVLKRYGQTLSLGDVA